MRHVGSSIQPRVIDCFKKLVPTQKDPLAAFVYDLPALREHVVDVMSYLPKGVELFYAIKANSEMEIINTIAPLVHGLEISSGGEVEKVAGCQVTKPFIFSGPGKLDSDITSAITKGVEFIHLESLREIHQLNEIAQQQGIVQKVLIRINPVLPSSLTTRLAMAGTATPFGFPEDMLEQAINTVDTSQNLSLCGFHVHAMSHQLETARHKLLLDFYLQKWPEWQSKAAQPQQLTHLNVGGGIGVQYLEGPQFDWPDFCEHLATSLKQHSNPPIIRFEPGRFISAYCGYYGIEILDIKHSYGEDFIVCRGGTHQFRLPAAQSHNHPIHHLPIEARTNRPKETPYSGRFTLVGQLCTPKDVLSRNVQLTDIRVGDLLILPMAGAYGHNISHINFLCHPHPVKHFILEESLNQQHHSKRTFDHA